MESLKKRLRTIQSFGVKSKSNEKWKKYSYRKEFYHMEKVKQNSNKKYYININYSSNQKKRTRKSERKKEGSLKGSFLKRSLNKSKTKNFNLRNSERSRQDFLPRKSLLNMKNLIRKSHIGNRSPKRKRTSPKTTTRQTILESSNVKKGLVSKLKKYIKNMDADSSKIKIVSRDKMKKKTSKLNLFKVNLKGLKNTKKENNNKDNSINGKMENKRVIKLYLKLEKLANAKSRSIELDKNNGKAYRKKNDFLSEDKDQSKYILYERPAHFLKSSNESSTKGTEKKLIPETRRENKYYQYLCNKLKNNKNVKRLSEMIKTRFKSWNKHSKAEFFNFKTNKDYYEISKRIGKGCFGKVYLATQLLTNTSVALKVISKTSIKNKDTRRKIEKEVDILKRINNNRYVIRLFEVFEDSENVFLVFEYIEKGDLVKYFKKNPLFEEQELKVFFKKIILGIKYLHKNKILHRDIKLDNILLNKKMEPKICDFGISSIYNKNKPILDTGGTPAYLAPEVIKSEGLISPKSDVWSLGVLLYLLTFGTVPFKSDDMQVLYNKIIIGRFSFPDCDFISPELVDLIEMMIVEDIDSRISIDSMLQHEWFEDIEEEEIKDSLTDKEKETVKIKGIELFLLDLGFPPEYITQTREKQLFNHVKACIDSLLAKFTVK